MKTIGGANPGLGSHVALLAELGIAALATDRDGIVRECNRAAAELYGLPEREMLGMSLSTVGLAQADEATAGSIVHGLLEMGRWRGEVEIEDAGGLALRLDVRARVILDGGDRPVGFEAVFGDLSGRVQAERRASELEPRLRTAQRIARLGAWSWDPRTDRLTTSDGFRSPSCQGVDGCW
jgi:PAS domain S-box-containing protein